MTITSASNKQIKDAVALYNASTRKKRKELIIEGLNECTRALKNGINAKSVFIYDNSEKEVLLSIKPYLNKINQPIICNKVVFKKLCMREESAKICIIAEQPTNEINDFTAPKNGLYLIMETVIKPGNLGALARTAISAGVDAIIITESQTELFNPNVIRASQGSIFEIPVFSLSNEDTLKFLNENSIKSYATLPLAKESLYQKNLKNSTAILLGTESTGLSEFWKINSDKKILIPMHGSIDSLNVSVSGAICLYEALRQRTV